MKGRSSHTELAALVQQLHLDLQHRAAPTCHLDHRLVFGFVSRSLRGVDNQAYPVLSGITAHHLWSCCQPTRLVRIDVWKISLSKSSGATFCILILPSIGVANTSCYSFKCSTSSLSARHLLSSTINFLVCSSHLSILKTSISFAPCLMKIWNSFFACLAMRSMLTFGSFGDRTCSFNSLVLTFEASLLSK